MAIHWFPGHMHATRKALAKRLPEVDVVIELLDARLPASSASPLLAQMVQEAGGRPCLKVLNKQDLAEPGLTEQWLAHYRAQPGTQALALDAAATAPARALLAACRALAPHRGGLAKPLRLVICGVPNVGKSTLVNTLRGQRIAKTGDEAGITKVEQRIALDKDAVLFDTPGMLWPRIDVEQSGLLLAASGAIGRNAFDDVEVALGLLERVRVRGPAALAARYGVKDLAALSDEALLHEVGKRHGGLRAGGQVDPQKAAERVITDFRTGAWGRLTLETPEEFARWQCEALAAQERKAQAQAARKAEASKGQRGGGAASTTG